MATKIARKITSYEVVKPETKPAAAKTGELKLDAEARLRLESVPTQLVEPRWEGRPKFPQGNDGHTYMIEGPEHKFGILIGQVTNGHTEPFEVWVLGDKAPRGLSVVAKSLSLDMRARDWGFVKRKLDALVKVEDKPFDMVMPDGYMHQCKSEVSAFAEIILHRCTELGVFERCVSTPLLDAMMSDKEPKTTPAGVLAPCWDIKNPVTEDDFVMLLKEVELPTGEMRPLSVWFANKYPKSLDALCKGLSLDFRVMSVSWGARKLRQLLDVSEDRGSFLAEKPGGGGKSAWYPSTVAYIAALLLQRMHVLGLVNSDGQVYVESVAGVSHLKAVENTETTWAPKGLLCESCGAYAVQRTGGCDVCAACGASHCGG